MAGQKTPTSDQMFADEFIGEVIQIGRLLSLHIDIPTTAQEASWMYVHPNTIGKVTAECRLFNPNDELMYVYEGSGKTMGLALRTIREKIREEFGR